MTEYDPFAVSYGLIHVLAGYASYHAWLIVPARDYHGKKNDDFHLPQYAADTGTVGSSSI